ncbi:MAG: HD domain-containing protein [Bacteriovorax sp.]|nr:HD domain-containing protein [Bacteriovorax sp.]
MIDFEKIFEDKIKIVLGHLDPAHDISHVKRVVNIAKKIAQDECGLLEVIMPAAWLHDLVNLPKNHPERSNASRMAAREALYLLNEIKYPVIYHERIAHAIEAHSFSAEIIPETLEAKIVQDADRLDGLGAIGLARLFSISTQLNRPFYDSTDPFAVNRSLDDKLYGIDHIWTKLKKVSESMHTPAAQLEAQKRFIFIEEFLNELKTEI